MGIVEEGAGERRGRKRERRGEGSRGKEETEMRETGESKRGYHRCNAVSMCLLGASHT